MKKIVVNSVLAILCFSIVITFIPGVFAQTNILPNSGFEDGLSSWNVTSGTAVYSIDSVTRHSGVSSVMGVETSPRNLGRLFQDVTGLVTPGNRYMISGWIKTNNVTGNVVIGLDYVASNNYTPVDGYIAEIGQVSGTKDWAFFESSVFTVPPMPSDAVALYFLFDFNMGAGTAWWDDVSLTLVSEPASPCILYAACHDGSDWLTIENYQLTLRHRSFSPIGELLNCADFSDYCGFIKIDGISHSITYVNGQYLIDNQSSLMVSVEALNRFDVFEGRGTVTWDGAHTILINDDGVGGGGLYSVQLCSQTATSQGDGWPMFGHDLSNARYSQSSAPHSSQILWSKTFDSEIRSAVTILGDRAYFGSFGGIVYAVNPSTGETIWSFSTSASVWCSPTIANNVIYVGSNDGVMYALNATTGGKIWDFTTGSAVWSSPAVVDGVVYFGSNDNNTYALDAYTGTKIWSFTTGGNIRDSPAVADGVVYIGSQDGYLYALNAATGKKIWSSHTGDTDTYTNSSPAVVNNTVYVGSGDNNLYAFQTSDGRQLWKYTAGGKVSSSPTVYNGVVYVGSEDSNLYAIDSLTGAKIWSQAADGPVYSSPAVADGIVYVGSWGNTIYAFDASTGASVWSYITDGGVFSSPTITGGVMFVGSYDYKVYAFGSSYDSGVISPSTPKSSSNDPTKTPWVPPAENGVVAVVVTAGVVSVAAVCVAAATSSASAGASAGIVGKLIDKLREFLPKTVKSWLEGVVASKNKLKIEAKTGSPYLPTKSEAIVYIISILVLTFSFAYVEVNNFSQIWLVLPTFFVTSIIVALIKTYILTVYSRKHEVWTEYKLWYLGVVMFLVSSLAFRMPFSSPTRTVHHSVNFTKRLGVLLSCVGIFITLAFAGLFFLLLKSGFILIGGTGLAMCLITAFFDMFPLTPMSGKTIFSYNKALWVGLFLMTLGFYAAWLMKIL